MPSLEDTSQGLSKLASLGLTPLDGVFALEAAFRADSDESKVNLGIGAYRDDEAMPVVLESVRAVRPHTFTPEPATHM